MKPSQLELIEGAKSRGAFFTPEALTDFVTGWAIRSSSDRVLEPSCGDARFLRSAAARLGALNPFQVEAKQLIGVELHPESALQSEYSLKKDGIPGQIMACDFFDFDAPHLFDAVIGNPPYVRYQTFSGQPRSKAQKAALAQGVRLTGLASSWAPFLVHAASLVKAGGRLGLVLPAELLSVNYAAPVRRFLMERFSHVRLVLFDGLVFPGVLEEVVLLMAEGDGSTDRFELFQVRDASELQETANRSWFTPTVGGKWTQALLSKESSEAYSDVLKSGEFVELKTWGRVNLGAVTGNNKFFALSFPRARELRLKRSDLLPISPPSSRHLRGLNFTERAWAELGDIGSACYLFYPDPDNLSEAARAYIVRGEDLGVQNAYKCQVRSPWWRVPLVRVPDLFLTYMNHDAPRLVANRAKFNYLNSVHGMVLGASVRELGMDLLPIAMLNSVTLLGAEIVGRSYGGGILKVEPGEASLIPVPTPEALERASVKLRELRPQIAADLRANRLPDAIHKVDKALLLESLRIERAQILAAKLGRQALFARRVARSRAPQ